MSRNQTPTAQPPIASDFELLEPPGGQRLRCRFEGKFEGGPVVWDATLMTLREAQSQRNFIEIGELGSAGRHIDIALDLATIDIPALRKTIIMIRNYKCLHRGRHLFGPSIDS